MRRRRATGAERISALALCHCAHAGFTVAELITVCAIIAILAAMALPVARFGIRRQKEIELQRAAAQDHRRHRHATTTCASPDSIKDQPESIGQGEYPKELEELIKGSS